MTRITLMLCALMCAHFSFSQTLTGPQAELVHVQAQVVKMDGRSKAPVFIEFRSNSFIAGSAAMQNLRSALGMRPEDTFSLIRSEQDELGVMHHRYQQLYKGLKVEASQYIIHEVNGSMKSANGLFHNIPDISTAPGLSNEAALNLALADINAKEYIWQNQVEEDMLKEDKHDAKATWYPKGELVILPNTLSGKMHTTALCWKFDIYSIEPLGRYNIYIDASSGTVLFKENRICNVAVTGSGNTIYNGTQTFTTDSVSAGNYRLRDNSRAGGVETYNLQKGTTYSNTDFTDADNVWTSVVNQDNAALDAHWGAQKTYDYFMLIHARNSYNNTGGALRSYVHYGNGYNNAFWDGTRMTYGDGNGTTFSPLTELDVCGHEITHGVTEYSSNLIYSYESGALNESFSDIFGKTIDFYANPSADWRIGGKCYTPGTPGDALRYMNNPGLDGVSADTYHGTLWYSGAGDNGGVHTNSGVQNFWYYLLVNGGAGTNDVGFNYNVTGIGMEKARRIAYRNNNVYLISSSQYADAAFYALKSAQDLFGNCSPEALAVKNAWDAVGITGLQLNVNAAASTTGGSCVGNILQFAASGGVTYAWTGPNAFSSNLQNPSIANVTAAAAGVYTCVITDANGCTGNPQVVVAINSPPTVNAGTDVTICNGGSANLNAIGSIGGSGGNSGTNASAVSIPDSPGAAIFSNINISGSTNADDVVSVTIDSLTHTWDSDLEISLVAPNGSEISLSSRNGGSADNYINTKFMSGAATAINLGAAPFSGTYLPQEAFSNLTGSANGTWKLKIQDMAGFDVGTLWKWSIVLPPNIITGYSWSPAGGLSNPAINNPVASPSSTTAYSVTVTDAQGCTSTDIVTVNVESLGLNASLTSASCGSSNGAIDLTVIGGTGANIYNWSNGATSEDLSALPAGDYTVTVTNTGCTATATFNVQTSGNHTLNGTLTQATCGSSNGAIDLSVGGGSGSPAYIWSNGATTQDITGLNAGTYTVTVNDPGCTTTGSFVISSSGNTPPAPAAVNGNSGACRGQNGIIYSVAPIAGALSYNWVLPTGVTGSSTTESITLNFGSTFSTSNICVSVTTACGTSTQTCRSITRFTASPGLPATIGGSAIACANSVQTYTVPPVTNATSYVWNIPANTSITNGAGTNSIQLTFNGSWTSGNLQVRALNCIGTSSNRSLALRGLPGIPANVTGNRFALCAGTTHPFSCPVTAGATSYLWSAPAGSLIAGQGTNNVQVTFPTPFVTGTVAVRAQNSCGNSAPRSVTVFSNPSTPGTISGPLNNNCGATNVTYTVAASTTGATGYNWTVPAFMSIVGGLNTNSIQVNFIGSGTGPVLVNASNACGNSANRTLSNVTTLPARPASISGPATVCANQAGVAFNVSSQPGVTYNWTAPAGASVATGQTTPAVTINWGTTAGNVAVVASNSCGNALSRTKAITINCRVADDVSDIQLFPNPASDYATLLVNDVSNHNYIYEVIDILGNCVATNNVSETENNIDIGHYAKGIYLLRLKNETGLIKTFRLVVQ